MSIKIHVPVLGESITEATIIQWYKQVGDAVAIDEPLCELETDKIAIEVPAPCAGVMQEIMVQVEETVAVGAVLGILREGKSKEGSPPPIATEEVTLQSTKRHDILAPSVRKLIEEQGLDAEQIIGTGKDGRLTKGDVMNEIAQRKQAMIVPTVSDIVRKDSRGEERVPMTRLRKTIAKRLKEAQNTAAMLTTFNDVDMSGLMVVRKEYKEKFIQKHNVSLGFMSFFVKACVMALQEIPSVNAEIDGGDVIYKHFVNMGIAVGTDKGLVVPVLRNAHNMGFADIEKSIVDFGERARSNQLTIKDLQAGTFTISNGGVYGSLMSTPILNAPQSGILGMHKIHDRPVVVHGEIVIRPMMYLALSYDHRLVDGREAVTFLVRVKEGIENPERLLLDL